MPRLEPAVLLVYHFRAARLGILTHERTDDRTDVPQDLQGQAVRPTPTQERELERVLRRCRTLYNVALEQRITAWQHCHVSIMRSQQEAELKAIRAEFPEYAAIHSHVLQDVLARLDRTYQAFFRRLAAGEQPGFPRFQGRDRWHSFTYKEYGNGARLDNGYLVLSTIGRIAVRWSRPVAGQHQDGHCEPRGGWLVRLLLVRGRAHPAVSSHRTRDRHRRGREGVPHHGGRAGRGEPAPLPHG
jgi:Helix-turn-helix domain